MPDQLFNLNCRLNGFGDIGGNRRSGLGQVNQSVVEVVLCLVGAQESLSFVGFQHITLVCLDLSGVIVESEQVDIVSIFVQTLYHYPHRL